jgi:hypothetical protein
MPGQSRQVPRVLRSNDAWLEAEFGAFHRLANDARRGTARGEGGGHSAA